MRRRVLLAASAVLLATSAAAPPASAEDLNGLGQKTQLVLTVDRLVPFVSYTRASVTSTAGNATVTRADSGTSFGFLFGTEPTLGTAHTIPRAAFDVVIVKGFTVGGAFAVAVGLSRSVAVESVPNNGGTTTRQENDEPRTTIFGFAPRFGYIIPFSQAFGFWPRLGFAFYSASTRDQQVNNLGVVVSTTTNSNTVFSLDLDPQFVVTPVEHFFIHFGPIFNIPLTGSNSVETVTGPTTTTTSNDLAVFHLGISVGLGTWF